MGLDHNALALIKALAENRIQDAKTAAVACCTGDTTKKNVGECQYYKKLLLNGNTKSLELPPNLTGVLNLINVSDFREERYYLSEERTELFKQIEHGVEVSLKLLEYGIHYMNSTLLYGEPGTGKTEFARYIAYKLGLPYAYVSFSGLIDSYMGSTSKNLQKVFDFCKGQKCVLMLDEVDCIGLKRGRDGGADGELGRTTIALMQALDSLVDGQIIIGATNRADRLDDALLRRFQRKVEFKKYIEEERFAMIKNFVNSVDASFWDDEFVSYAKEVHTQAETVNFIIEKIAQMI